LSGKKDSCGIFFKNYWLLHGLFLNSGRSEEYGLIFTREHLLLIYLGKWFGRIEFYLNLFFSLFHNWISCVQIGLSNAFLDEELRE